MIQAASPAGESFSPQPWVSTIGIGSGPLPRSWMKWIFRPSMVTLKWENALRARSRARQSKYGHR